jgi:hypothetical protein
VIYYLDTSALVKRYYTEKDTHLDSSLECLKRYGKYAAITSEVNDQPSSS